MSSLPESIDFSVESLVAGGAVVKDITIGATTWDSVNRTQYCQRHVTTAMFPRSCVVQAVSRLDEPQHSIHASM